MKLALVALVLAAGCTAESTSSKESLTRLPGECGDDEVHVVGVYEPETNPPSGGGGDDGQGHILVHVDRPGRHTIVVSSHEAATWQIVTSNGAELRAVYAVGKGKQTVLAPSGTKVMTDSEADGTWACGYSWPGNTTCDTKSLLHLSSIRLDKHATSFHGCYKATTFTIGEDLAVTSDCTDLARSSSPQDDIITRCDPDQPQNDCDGVVLY